MTLDSSLYCIKQNITVSLSGWLRPCFLHKCNDLMKINVERLNRPTAHCIIKKRLMSSKKHSVITDVHSETVKSTGDKLGISTNSQNLNILPKSKYDCNWNTGQELHFPIWLYMNVITQIYMLHVHQYPEHFFKFKHNSTGVRIPLIQIEEFCCHLFSQVVSKLAT